MTKILIIDDDVELAGLFKEYLERDGFAVEVSHQSEPGLRLALSGDYQLVILDIMLPDIKGTEVLIRIRMESHPCADVYRQGRSCGPDYRPGIGG